MHNHGGVVGVSTNQVMQDADYIYVNEERVKSLYENKI